MASRTAPFDRWARFRALVGAWERLSKKDCAAGADGITAASFAAGVTLELDALHDELRTGRFRPRPLRCFTLRDGDREREISIPAMRDRVVQEAIRPVLEEALRGRLSPNCHGYVRGRSTATAQHAAAALVATGFVHLHGLDIRNGFGSVDRARLVEQLGRVLDRRTADTIGGFLAADRKRDGRTSAAGAMGIPLGQPLSPPCFNVYLLPIDRALDEADVRWVRYADDILLFGRDENELDRALEILDGELERIGLLRKVEKDRRARVEGDPFAFLGRFLAPGIVMEAVAAPAAKHSFAEEENPEPSPPDRPPWFRTLYLQQPGAWVHRKEGHAVVRAGAVESKLPLRDIDRVVVMSNVGFSAPFLASCLERGIPVHFTLARGRNTAFGSLVRSDAETPLRTRSQLEAHGDEAFRLALARSIVRGKINNSRWLLRQMRADRSAVRRLGLAIPRLDQASTIDEVLGVEGHGALLHFRALGARVPGGLGFTGRTRRPPRDPFNSLLSFGYTLLFTEMHSLLIQHRLNPFVGYLHALRDAHPALASDMIEEFRAPLVDRFCARVANRRQLQTHDFDPPRANGAVFMKSAARKRFLELWEQHMQAPFCRVDDGDAIDARRTMERQVRRILDVVLCRVGDYLPFDAADEHVAARSRSALITARGVRTASDRQASQCA